ncbi:hypothetical protein P7C70_g4254, partial [Phenoliferia sp. Uapishka_3]
MTPTRRALVALGGRAYSTAAPRPLIPQLLLKEAIPLIPTHGFSIATLQAASLALPPPHTPPPPGYSDHTLNALFPSAPPTGRFRKSLSREELIAEARGAGISGQRVGPAKALVEAWLEEGRAVMVSHVQGRWKGDQAVQEGIRERLRFNEPMRASLADALALLGATTASPLSSIAALLPIPSPKGYLEHCANVAQSLAKASGDESQGVGSYYPVNLFHLLMPSCLGGMVWGASKNRNGLWSRSLSALPPSERLASTLDLVDSLLAGSSAVHGKVKHAEEFGSFVVRSWMGIGRSMGF